MKYIFDHRYKTVHTLIFYLSSLGRICKLGQSEVLNQTLHHLEKGYELLEPMKSAPFSDEEIETISMIQSGVLNILHLPEDVLSLIDHVRLKSKALLDRIDPFTTGFEESIHIRRSLLVELVQEIHLFVKSTTLDLETVAKALVEEKSILHKVIKEIVLIPYHDFPEEEKEALVTLLQNFEEFRKNPNAETAKPFFAKALATEKVLRGEGRPNLSDLSATLQFLYDSIMVSEKLMSLKAEDFPKFKDSLQTPHIKQAVIKITEARFETEELNEIKDTLGIAHRNLLLEPGDTLTSRTRTIELFRVFGHEVISLRVQTKPSHPEVEEEEDD